MTAMRKDQSGELGQSVKTSLSGKENKYRDSSLALRMTFRLDLANLIGSSRTGMVSRRVFLLYPGDHDDEINANIILFP